MSSLQYGEVINLLEYSLLKQHSDKNDTIYANLNKPIDIFGKTDDL